ncbi:SDR family NAD(P)-dependent oxidoreductase [bacterium]|nr:SDR family NAD(P)-dependent oxidoreductase [bacterium]
MKKVLITGGAGFIGSNFVRKFLELDHQVYVIEKKESNLWRLKDIKNKIKINYIDLKDFSKLKSFIIKTKPQIILHFAAYGTYPRRQQDIKMMIDTNLLGTINLVNALSKIKFDCFINTSSSSEYGIKDKPMKETDLLEPNNLYGITKAASTMYCQNIARELDLPIVTTRVFAAYGYFEAEERLIPTIIKSCLKNKKLKLSSPYSVRDFIFIEDIIDAYLKIIKNIQRVKGEVFNLGTGKQIDIDQIVSLIKEITNSKIKPEYNQIKLAQKEPKNWVADNSKIKQSLNWYPKYSLKQGFKKDTEWFKKNIFYTKNLKL